MSALQRCEIWSSYQCDSGTRQAVLPLDHIVSLTTTERTTREDEGTLVISKDAAAYTYLLIGYVLRLLFTDGSFQEWRIQSLTDESRRSRLVTVGLTTPLLELATRAMIATGYVQGDATQLQRTVTGDAKSQTPTIVIDATVGYAPSFWARGTVTPTIAVSLGVPSGWMPLQLARECVAAIRAQGVDAELDYRRNGTSGYYLDVVSQIGSSAATLDVRTAKNLTGTSRRQDRDRYATEVVPLGDGGDTMARAYWEVTAKASTTLTVQQPYVGGAMIAFNGQLDGLYLLDDAGATQLISNSLAAGTFDVASAANVTAGRWYRIVADAAGVDLLRNRKAPAVSGPIQVVRVAGLDATTNFIKNPAMRVWTGGSSVAPDDWTSGTGTLTREANTPVLYGPYSARLQNTVSGGTLQATTPSIYIPAYVTYVQYTMWVMVISALNTPQVNFKRDGLAPHTTVDLSTYPTGSWQRIDYAYSTAGLTGAVHSFQVLADFQSAAAAGEIYVDSAQVTFTDSAEAFVEGSAPARLWTAANRYLTKYSTVPTTYRISFADLGAWDPVGFPYDTVTLGQTANVKDTDLGFTVSARVLELTRDWKNPLASEVTIASVPDDLVTLLTGLA